MSRSSWIEDRGDRGGLRWRARYRAPDGRVRSRSFRRKVDAERWLTDELGKVDQGAWIDPASGEILLEEWCRVWLAGLTVKPKTRAGYEQVLASRILPRFGPYQLRTITTAEVRAFITGILDEGKVARARQARAVLSQVMAAAVGDGLIARNPVANVKAPRLAPRRQLFLRAEEVRTLADACETRQPSAGAVVTLLAWSGLRWGEMVALRWSAMDTGRRRIRVKASATELSGRLVWGSPKTHEARTVIVPRFVIDTLGTEGLSDQLVFTAPRGGPLRSSNWRRDVWLPAVAASGLPTDLVPHDLRDTAASLAISTGASIKAVQRMLGHASAAMTLDVYGSLFEEDLEALADRLEERFAASAAPGAPPARPQGAQIVRFPR